MLLFYWSSLLSYSISSSLILFPFKSKLMSEQFYWMSSRMESNPWFPLMSIEHCEKSIDDIIAFFLVDFIIVLKPCAVIR